jgi:hypothetical protein
MKLLISGVSAKTGGGLTIFHDFLEQLFFVSDSERQGNRMLVCYSPLIAE